MGFGHGLHRDESIAAIERTTPGRFEGFPAGAKTGNFAALGGDADIGGAYLV
jgi:hypothetical protein